MITFGNRQDTTYGSKASLFNDYFCSVFRNDHIDIFPGLPTYPVGALSSLSLRQDRVEQLLKKSNLTKVLAVTMFSNKVLKYCASPLSIPLTSIFQKSLHAGVFPTNICPIHKGFSNISSEFPSNFNLANIVQNSGKKLSPKT